MLERNEEEETELFKEGTDVICMRPRRPRITFYRAHVKRAMTLSLTRRKHLKHDEMKPETTATKTQETRCHPCLSDIGA